MATAARVNLDDATAEVYAEALVSRVTPDEWESFTRDYAARITWFPKLVELLDALQEYRGAPSLDVEASAAYERVVGCRRYHPESGSVWVFRDIQERCGKAAAHAFLAAEGHAAFATTWDEARRRKAFIAAYKIEARAFPEQRLPALPPGHQQPALPSGDEAVEISSGDAVCALEKIRTIAGAKAAPSKAPTKTHVRASAERLEMLRQQAEEITR